MCLPGRTLYRTEKYKYTPAEAKLKSQPRKVSAGLG
jgi:hypothetical protein